MPLPTTIAQSLADKIPIIYLINKEVRYVLGKSGIQHICRAEPFLNDTFSNPDEFNSLLMNTNIVLTGTKLSEYIYFSAGPTYRIETYEEPSKYNEVIIYYNNNEEHKSIQSYLAEYENQRFTKLYSKDIARTRKSNTLVRLRHINNKNNQDYSIRLTRNGFSITHVISSEYKDEWTKKYIESIHLSIPSLGFFNTAILSTCGIEYYVTLIVPFRFSNMEEELTVSSSILHNLDISFSGDVSIKLSLFNNRELITHTLNDYY